MADGLIDDMREGDEDEIPLSPRRKLAAAVVIALVVLASAAVMVRVSSPPIPPDQDEPSPHWGPKCEWCHSVTASARPIEVKQ